MKKVIGMVLIMGMVVGMGVAYAHPSEEMFDEDMIKMENFLRNYHPEVVWVDVNGVRIGTVVKDGSLEGV